MCLICDGMSYEDVRRQQVSRIEEFGWTLMGVEARVPWVYTIGLRWTLGHPELILVGGDPHTFADTMHAMIDEILAGDRDVLAGDRIDGPAGPVRIGHVHSVNLAGEWFAQWSPVARAAGFGTASLRALQVLDDASGGPQVLLDRRQNVRSVQRSAERRACEQQREDH